MDTESKLIIEKLMLAFLALKTLLHKSGIVFEETEKTKEEQQGYGQPGKPKQGKREPIKLKKMHSYKNQK